MKIDWLTTWTMIMALGTIVTSIGTVIMSLAIIVSAIIALLSWRKSKIEEREKYILDRQSLSCGILAELNSNENLMKYLKVCKIIVKNDVANFAQSTSGGDYILDYDGIINIFINNFESVSFDYLKRSGISYKEFGMIFELTFIYKKIGMIKKLLSFMLNEMKPESSQFIGENSIRFAINTMDQIREDIDKALTKINKVYEMFKDETNFDFINSKYYRKLEPLFLK